MKHILAVGLVLSSYLRGGGVSADVCTQQGTLLDEQSTERVNGRAALLDPMLSEDSGVASTPWMGSPR